MIIFGTRGKTYEGPEVRGHVCGNCGQDRHVSFGLLRYFHVFWVPVIPVSRKLGLECANCKHTELHKSLPGTVTQDVRSAIFTRGRVLPMFTGAAVLVVLVGIVGISVQQEAEQRGMYVQAPQVDDLYVVDLFDFFENMDAEYRYGVMRVVAVDDASLEVVVGDYGYSSSSVSSSELADTLARPDAFSEERFFVDRDFIVDLEARGDVYKVYRAP